MCLAYAKVKEFRVIFLFLVERGSVSGVAARNFGVCRFSPTLRFPLLLSCINDQAIKPVWEHQCLLFWISVYRVWDCLPHLDALNGFSGWFEIVWIITHFFCRHNCFFSCRLKPFLFLILSMSLNGP